MDMIPYVNHNLSDGATVSIRVGGEDIASLDIMTGLLTVKGQCDGPVTVDTVPSGEDA